MTQAQLNPAPAPAPAAHPLGAIEQAASAPVSEEQAP